MKLIVTRMQNVKALQKRTTFAVAGVVLRFCSTKNPLGNSRKLPKWVAVVYKPVFARWFNRPPTAYNRYLNWWLKVGEAEPLPLSVTALRRLRSGSSSNEVLRRIGPPQEAHELYGEHRWFYYGTNSSKIVYVTFDTNMLYRRFEFEK